MKKSFSFPRNLKIQHFPSKILRERCSEIPYEAIKMPQFKVVIHRMFEIMKEEKGVGIAAPQVGWPVRLFLALEKSGEKENEFKQRVFINPKLEPSGNNFSILNEGCLSIPFHRFLIKRPASVKVDYLDEEGISKNETFLDEYFSRILFHENDHLNGILCSDYILGKYENNELPSYCEAAYSNVEFKNNMNSLRRSFEVREKKIWPLLENMKQYKKIVVFAHGKESGPVGQKSLFMNSLINDNDNEGFFAPDFRNIYDVSERVEKLSKFILEIEKEKIPYVLIGSSFGGLAALLAVCRYKLNPKALILCAPSLRKFRKEKNFPDPKVPTQIIHGSSDLVCPLKDSEAFASMYPETISLTIVNDSHNLQNSLEIIGKSLKTFLD